MEVLEKETHVYRYNSYMYSLDETERSAVDGEADTTIQWSWRGETQEIKPMYPHCTIWAEM